MLTPIQRLKIELMTQGMSLTPKARNILSNSGNHPLTMADYASTSGISMELQENVWLNAPIEDHNPNFVNQTKYTLDYEEGDFWLKGDLEVKAKPIPVSEYHHLKSPLGVEYSNYAITHTDRVRISPIQGCAFSCQFCDIPFVSKYKTKAISELIASLEAALEDSGGVRGGGYKRGAEAKSG